MIIALMSMYIPRGYTVFLCLILSTWSGNIVANASSSDTLGAVSSESKLCSEIGIELLKRGVSSFIPWYEIKALITRLQGNAADALVGTQLCVGVVGRSDVMNMKDKY
jgi:gamma-glutamyltranspeptidase/glutathione hydrolase